MEIVPLGSSKGIRLFVLQLGGSEPFFSNDEHPLMPREPLRFVCELVSLVSDLRAVNGLYDFPWGTKL